MLGLRQAKYVTTKSIDQHIEENAAKIVERFVDVAREHALPTRSLTREQVADHLHRYLAEMVAVLRAGQAERVAASETAREHGQQRWYAGYDLKSVVLEYAIFRTVILEILALTGASLTLENCEPLGHFINVAIADAAVEFMEKSVAEVNGALQNANRATASRDEVLAIVSHDLKNPLSIIEGSAALLDTALDATDREASRAELRKGVGRIQRACVTMNRLITDLLDLGRLRAGELELQPAEHAAEDLLREATEQVAPLAERRSIIVTSDVSPAARVTCDRARVLQILVNLLGNAIKFTAKGGTVTMRASTSSDECTFEVTDTGPGIAEEALKHVFDKYWQASATAAQGTGLGLSIASGFVELHGGRIWCESKLGKGSSFFFALPKTPPKTQATPDAERPLASR